MDTLQLKNLHGDKQRTMRCKQKGPWSSYAALIFHHFAHTGRTINQPFTLSGATTAWPATGRRTESQTPEENLAGDDQGQTGLIEV